MRKIAWNIFNIFSLVDGMQKSNSAVRVSRALVIGTLLLAALVVFTGCPDDGGGGGGGGTIPENTSANLMFTLGANGIILSWNEFGGAASYRVYRNNTLRAMDITVLTYTDSTVVSGTDYSYTVRTVNNNGTEGASSAAVSVQLPNEFDTLATAGNTAPRGLWSDGTTMWVADSGNRKIYAYNLATKARDDAKDFDTLSDAGNDNPNGLWSNGTIMWVSDDTDNKIYAYNLATKERDGAKDFNTLIAAGNIAPRDIWGNDSTMYVMDAVLINGDIDIYAYNMGDKQRNASRDFTSAQLQAAGGVVPKGIWSDGIRMWVAHGFANIIGTLAAYDLTTKAPIPNQHFTTLTDAGNTEPRGVWANDTTIWVVDLVDNRTVDPRIFAYSLATKEHTP